MVDHTEYRLAMILPKSRDLLVVSTCGHVHLPRISIPKWQRPAEQLTRAIEEQWQIKGIALDICSNASAADPCAIVEVRTPLCPVVPAGLRLATLEEIPSQSLSDSERSYLHAILVGDRSSGPFSRISWVDEAQLWLRCTLGDVIGGFAGIHQINASSHFALIRLVTTLGTTYWLKGVGEPNTHEFQITLTLAKHATAYVPSLVAARQDWNAWIVRDAGIPLDSTSDVQLCRAAETLAELQQATIPHIDVLFESGCSDHRLPVLRARIPAIIEYLQEAMALQISRKVPRLSSQCLQSLEKILVDCCDSMEAIGVPNTLISNDISEGNILFDGQRCVFNDWAEACIGHPFIAFQLLNAHVSPNAGRTKAADRVRAVYETNWLDRLSPVQIKRAFAFAPILAILSYLYGRGTWLHSTQRHDASFQGYARSLARRMNRAAQEPELVEALCQA